MSVPTPRGQVPPTDGPKAADTAASTDPDKDEKFIINGGENIKEALGFLKDWVTSLVGIQTAAIGAIGAFLSIEAKTHLSMPQALTLYATLIAFVYSIICGGVILYMLPGCTQRTPIVTSNDIYSMATYGKQTLGNWAKRFWFSFVIGIVLFALFIVVRTLPVGRPGPDPETANAAQTGAGYSSPAQAIPARQWLKSHDTLNWWFLRRMMKRQQTIVSRRCAESCIGAPTSSFTFRRIVTTSEKCFWKPLCAIRNGPAGCEGAWC